jgi:outer membrane protein assembly factor BamB
VEARTIAVVVLAAARLAAAGADAPWPWYGGPNHNGVLHDANTVPTGKDMKVLWKAPMLMPGHSGPAVVDGLVFIVDRRGNGDDAEDVLRVLDLQTGKERWSFSHKAPGDARPQAFGYMPHRAGPASVPIVTGAHVFFTGTRARLYCIDRKTHKAVWSVQLPTLASGAGSGVYSPSPLLADGKVIVSYSKAGSDVLEAYGSADGAVAWTARPDLKREQEHGMVSVVHASPILADVLGERQVVATHKRVTFGADPETGKVLWQYEGYRRGTIQAEVAISSEGYLFFTSGHDGASALVKMTKDEKGYHFRDIYNDGPKMRSKTRACSEWRPGHWWDGHLYHVSNHFASHGLLCMNDQGEVLWKTRTTDRKKRGPNFRYSCLTIVSGIGLAMNGGTLHVIDLDPQTYKELGSLQVFRVDEIDPGRRPEGMKDRAWKSYPRRLAFSTWAKHAYADGLFLTRNGQWLACVRVAPCHGPSTQGAMGRPRKAPRAAPKGAPAACGFGGASYSLSGEAVAAGGGVPWTR